MKETPTPPARPGPERGRTLSRLELGLALATAAGVVAVLLSRATRLRGMLLGVDTYPAILSSRILSLRDLVDTFSESLLEQVNGATTFYRPLLNLSLALDYAVGELEPRVYLATNALVFAAWAVALLLLARRFLQPAPAWLALALFLVHPLHAEALFVASRRAELLAGLFMTVALWAQARGGRSGWPRAALVAVAATLAMLAKETAFVLPALCALVGAFDPEPAGAGRRAAGAIRGALPATIALALVLALRSVAFGGLPLTITPEAGSSTIGVIGALRSLPRLVELGGGRTLAALVVGALALGGVLLALSLRRRAERGSERFGAGRAALLGASFLLATLLPIALVVQSRPWYFVLPVAGAALLFGAACELVLDGARRAQGATRATAWATCALLLVLLGAAVERSPLTRAYPQFERGSAAGAEFLAALERAVNGATAGATVTIALPPLRATGRPGEPSARAVSILMPHSVRAWCALRLARFELEVVDERALPALPPADPRRIRVVLARPAEAGVSPAADPVRPRL